MIEDSTVDSTVETVAAEAAPVAAPVTAEAAPVDFRSSLPEDLRSHDSLKDIQDVAGLAKGYVSAQSMIGSSVRIPGEDASAEAKAEFYKRLEEVPGVVKMPDEGDPEAMNAFLTRMGRPAEASQYEFTVPEGVELTNTEQLDKFKNLAFDLGLNKNQADALLQFRLQEESAQNDALAASLESATATLKTKWGGEFNNRLTGAKSVLDTYAETMPDAIAELRNSDLKNNPALAVMLADLAVSMKESGHVGAVSDVVFGTSADEALRKIQEISDNPAHPANRTGDPEHDAAQQKLRKLYEIAYAK